MSVYFLDIPCVAEIEKIRNANVGTEKQYDSGLHGLYKIHLSGEYAEYQGIFDAIPEDDESDYIVVPIESIFDGLYSVPEGTTFVNVIGSSQDHPSRGHSWLGFYELYSGESPYMCYTDGKLLEGKNQILFLSLY